MFDILSHRRAAASLALSNLAFCGEIHDAAQSGDLDKVKTLLKDHSDLVSSEDGRGGKSIFHNARRVYDGDPPAGSSTYALPRGMLTQNYGYII